ncbi:butyryl-CoA dehydrogenase [Candidatus Planktophila limnetica]|uniref:Broad-specificity linear acyl-CoA dehydrogenase FadE5 n=1 Tax=Candidatus Planktophila limnetica TaxID=573600 RepID=A0A249LH81_9ACTN|nr:acyl-CoA dehydrogenase [Candidatus Planktophila limnetica]ASY28294.1 butyryl-CoA dehydrogenase [Candidatus Planktophila limnetica]
MSHYTANLRDIEFCLFDLLGAEKILGTSVFSELDRETTMGMLDEMKRLTENDLAASFVDGDRIGTDFNKATGDVKLPESFKKSYKAYIDGEWWRIDTPVPLGGTKIPASVRWAIAEMVLGSNPSIHIYASGYAFSHVAFMLGTEEQKHFAKLMVDRHWGATMQLTEPDAGSDVGAGRSKAVQQSDGTWHITGTKRYITSGDADIFENIMHFTLARREGGGPGTKGLSLFLIPKFMFDHKTGDLGKRNGVYVTGVEHKMGLNVSATCEVNLGEKEPAVGYLLGDVHEGIAQMFKVIEFARMMVGTKAIATLSAGYQQALSYAKTRIQGGDMKVMNDKASPRVSIIKHPDVRRSLMVQKSYSEGMRALVLYTASIQDEIELAREAGNADRLKDMEALNDLLLPVVKGFGSEKSWTLLGTESLQTFGGAGFTQDWPLEQYVRDAKIDTLYEGTTAIQGLDFFFRKVVKDGGRALGLLGKEIADYAQAGGAHPEEKAALLKAVGDLNGIVGVLVGHAMASQESPIEIYKVGLNTSRCLMAVGDIITAWLLLRQADIAAEKLKGDAGKDKDFFTGKIASAKFFCLNYLPHITADRKIVEGTDGAIMEIPESAF